MTHVGVGNGSGHFFQRSSVTRTSIFRCFVMAEETKSSFGNTNEGPRCCSKPIDMTKLQPSLATSMPSLGRFSAVPKVFALDYRGFGQSEGGGKLREVDKEGNS